MINSKHIGSFVRTKFRRFQTEKNGCYICWKNFLSLDELQFHLDLHSNSVIIKNVNASWKSLRWIYIFHFPAKFYNNGFQLFSFRNEQTLHFNVELIAARLIFEIKNNGKDDVIINCIGVYNDILQFGKLNPNEFPVTIKQGEKSLNS